MTTYRIKLIQKELAGAIISLPFDQGLDKETAEKRAAAYRAANQDPLLDVEIVEEES